MFESFQIGRAGHQFERNYIILFMKRKVQTLYNLSVGNFLRITSNILLALQNHSVWKWGKRFDQNISLFWLKRTWIISILIFSTFYLSRVAFAPNF